MNFKEKNNEQYIELSEYRTINDDPNEENGKSWFNFTVEPMWLGTISSLTMGYIAFQNLFIEKACTVNLGYSEDVCFQSNTTFKREIEMECQKIVTSLSIGSNFVEYLFIFLTVLFLGSWSISKGKRKPAILIPIFGMLTTSACLLILQAFPKISTVWILYIKVLPYSIGGSISLMTMATFDYLGNICCKTGRSITNVKKSNSVVISLSTVIGFLFVPVLLKNFKFIGVFVTLIVLELASFLYCFYKIKDSTIAEKETQIFNLSLPLEYLKCVFKKRNGNKRKNVLLMVLVPCTTSITLLIEIVPLYLYFRHKFQWTEIEYGLFSAYREIIYFIGSTIILKIFTKFMNLRSKTIGIIGSVSQFMSTSVLILSTESWMIFLAPIVGIISRAVFIAEKSILNKQITSSEEDKFNFIATVLDAITAMWAIPLANYIYFISIMWMPNLFLFLSLLAAGGQLLLYYYVSDS